MRVAWLLWVVMALATALLVVVDAQEVVAGPAASWGDDEEPAWNRMTPMGLDEQRCTDLDGTYPCEDDFDCPPLEFAEVHCVPESPHSNVTVCNAFTPDGMLGDACDVEENIAAHLCRQGTCGIFRGVCQALVPFQCGACITDEDCAGAYGFCDPEDHVCRYRGAMSTGDTCFADSWCASNYCDVGKCYQKDDGKRGLACGVPGSCPDDMYCLQGTCTPTPDKCQHDEECGGLLLVCNSGKCVDAHSLAIGSPCTTSLACSSGSCVPAETPSERGDAGEMTFTCQDRAGKPCDPEQQALDCGIGETDGLIECSCSGIGAKDAFVCNVRPSLVGACVAEARLLQECQKSNLCVVNYLTADIAIASDACVSDNCFNEAMDMLCCSACRNDEQALDLDCAAKTINKRCVTEWGDPQCAAWEAGRDTKGHHTDTTRLIIMSMSALGGALVVIFVALAVRRRRTTPVGRTPLIT